MQGEQNLIIAGDNQEHVFNPSGDTHDIVAAISEADKMSIGYVRAFAESMRGADEAETCANLWHWVQNNIPYHEDPEGVQGVQLPGQLYLNRRKDLGGTGWGGDCKSMSLFCSSVLRALGNYDFKYRFISEKRNENYHHVYLIVGTTDSDGNPCYIPLDCTLKNFAVEVQHAKKLDVQPTAPGAAVRGIAGVGAAAIGEFNFFKIGATTVAEAETSYWQLETDDLKKNNIAKLIFLKTDMKLDIFNKWARSHPIRYSEFMKAMLKNFEAFLTLGSCLIYYYWNNRIEFVAYGACRGADTANFGKDIPFPDKYAAKKATAKQFRDALAQLGLSNKTIRQLANLGCYYKYGIGLDYQLYRCYCIELYGQPFSPKPGVPYWDNSTGSMNNNGAPLADSLSILACFPAQGGVGRPFGEPYWSTGGHIINNGASDEVVKSWATANPRPGTPIDGDTSNLVEGIIFNNGAGISFEKQMDAMVIYNRWAKGNMVVLPQAPTTCTSLMHSFGICGTQPDGNYPAVGEAIVWTATTVIALITAIALALTAVAAIIKLFLDAFKSPNGQQSIPLPTMDFKWDYQTPDGCMIGHCTNPNGCGGAQTAKMCGGKIVELNPNPNDPKNQPTDAGNFFMGGTKNKKLLAGVGVAALGVGLLALSSGDNRN